MKEVTTLAYKIYEWRQDTWHWGTATRDYSMACYLLDKGIVKGNESRIVLETIFDENYG